MNMGKVVPSITERLEIKENLRIKDIVIKSLDGQKTLFLDKDIFQKSIKTKETPQNLFELLQRLLSPQKNDVQILTEKLSSKLRGYKIYAEIDNKNLITDAIDATVMEHQGGFATVGASKLVGLSSDIKIPQSFIADGYKNGNLVSSENHFLTGPVYYKNIFKNSNGTYISKEVTKNP